jgi:opacity protein-like surface antigen
MTRYQFILFLALAMSFLNLCSYGQELRPVKGQNNKWGFVNETGKEIIPFMFKDVGEFSEGLARVRITDNWGFIDKTGVIIPARYFAVGDFSDGLARVKNINGEWGFIDKTGQEVIFSKYYGAGDFSEGLARVKTLTGRWGFINRKGNAVISFMYKDAKDFSGGLAQVKVKRKWIYIDKTGKEVVHNVSMNVPANSQTQNVQAFEETRDGSTPEAANSYDVILLKNGQEIKAKVNEITLSEIKYKLYDNIEGPTRTEAKNDVFAVIYANGMREIISTASSTKTKGASDRAGKMEIGVSPVFYTENDISMFGFCGKLRVGVGNYIRLEVPFTYYLPKTETEKFLGIDIKTKYNMWDASLNMQTIVTKDDKFLLYPAIGVRISGLKASASALGESDSESKTVFGMNFGAGFDVKLANKFYFNLEPRYMLSFIDGEAGHGFSASAGFIIRF